MYYISLTQKTFRSPVYHCVRYGYSCDINQTASAKNDFKSFQNSTPNWVLNMIRILEGPLFTSNDRNESALVEDNEALTLDNSAKRCRLR